jgi:hypothetical protein
LVHSSGYLLAAGAGGAVPVSSDLAGAAAVPDCGGRGVLGFVSGLGDFHPACSNITGNLKNMAMEDFIEEIKVMSHELADKVKALIHQGNVNRIIIKDDKGNTFVEIPVTVAAVGAVFAPVVAAVGTIAAMAAKFTIVVQKNAPGTPAPHSPPSDQ